MSKTRIPSIPPPRGSDPNKAVLETSREALNVLLGRQGDPLDRAITLRELVNSGVVQVTYSAAGTPGTGIIQPAPSPGGGGGTEIDLTPPPQPTNLQTSSYFGAVQLSWDGWGGTASVTEIWRHTSDVQGSATLIGLAGSTQYVDYVDSDITYYYWVRFRSAAEVTGPFNASAGVTGQAASNATKIEIVADVAALNALTGNFEGRIVYVQSEGILYRYHSGGWVKNIDWADVTNRAIGTADFASGIEPVKVVGTQPSTTYLDATVVFYTGDNKLYRWNGSAYIKTVVVDDFDRQLDTIDISDDAITAAKILSGELKIALNAEGMTPVEIVSSLPGSGLFDGRLVFLTSDKKLYRYRTTAPVGWTKAVDGADITANTITAGSIAAGAISARELAIHSPESFKLDSQYANSSCWLLNGSPIVEWLTDSDAVVKDSLRAKSALKVGVKSTDSSLYAYSFYSSSGDLDFPVRPLEKYRLRCRLYTSDANWPIRAYLALKNNAGTYTWPSKQVNPTDTDDYGNTPASIGGYTLEHVFTTLDNTVAARVLTPFMVGNASGTGSWYITDISVERVVGTTLIADGAISTAKIAANAVTANEIDSRNLTIKDAAGNILFGAGTNLAAANITPSSGWLNSNISIASNGTLSGAGGGQVTIAGMDSTVVRSANPINSGNVSTYIANAAIGTAQISNITSDRITANWLTAGAISAGAIGASEIASGAITAEKLAVVRTGSALNKDPQLTTGRNSSSLGSWYGTTLQNSVIASEFTPNYSFSDPKAGPVGLLYNGSAYREIWSDRIPIDQSKTYRLQVWVKRTSGSPTGYHSVAFYDASGNRITSTAGYNWPSNGTYWYWGMVGGSYPSAWTKHEFTFGAKGTGGIPSNAYSISLGMLVNYNSSGSTILSFQDYRLEEVIGATMIEDGSITTDKIVATGISADRITTGTLNAANVTVTNLTGASINAASLGAIKATLGDVSSGTITLDASGHIKAGQTAYNTGNGFWLGRYSAGNYRFSIGDGGQNVLTWDGTTLTVKGNVQAGNYAASDNVLASALATEQWNDDNNWVELKKFQVDRGGSVRLTFEAWRDFTVGSVQTYPQYRIKKNGAVTSGPSNITNTSAQTKTITSISVNGGDTIAVEVIAGWGDVYAIGEPDSIIVYLRNAYIKGDLVIGTSNVTVLNG